MDITAQFDDVDMAQAALVGLQSLGVFPRRYTMNAMRPGGTQLLLSIDDASAGRARSALISNHARRVRFV